MPVPSQAAHHEKAAPRLTLGDFELTLLSDGTYWLDGGAFIFFSQSGLGKRR